MRRGELVRRVMVLILGVLVGCKNDVPNPNPQAPPGLSCVRGETPLPAGYSLDTRMLCFDTTYSYYYPTFSSIATTNQTADQVTDAMGPLSLVVEDSSF